MTNDWIYNKYFVEDFGRKNELVAVIHNLILDIEIKTAKKKTEYNIDYHRTLTSTVRKNVAAASKPDVPTPFLFSHK